MRNFFIFLKSNNKIWLILSIFIILIPFGLFCWQKNESFLEKKSLDEYVKTNAQGQVKSAEISNILPKIPSTVNKDEFDNLMLKLANLPAPTSSLANFWPAKPVYPLSGALLPYNRIVAFYGNFYSKNMGILGELPEDDMLDFLAKTALAWQEADTSTPVVPALHYIAVVAHESAGKDGKFRLRMPEDQIQKAISLADKIHGIVFLDIQAGFSDIQTELPLLKKYLQLPQVHLGIDPEFYMKGSTPPGKAIGSLDAEEINFAANFLANVVKQNNLPPKILIVHRFTQKMVTNYQNISPLPEVQIVMNMDGWGGNANKINTYKNFISKQPVQFTGFKIFYKNDLSRKGSHLLSPLELLQLTPMPIYIQYQ